MGTQSALKLWWERGYWRTFTYYYDDILSYETEIGLQHARLSIRSVNLGWHLAAFWKRQHTYERGNRPLRQNILYCPTKNIEWPCLAWLRRKEQRV
jgi:hypothetical protein